MTRKSIHVEGLGHGDLPIPSASRIGPFVATGGIRGVDRKTNTLPADEKQQAELMFDNLVAVLEAAGARAEDVLKVTIWVADAASRPAINPPWLRLFPDPQSRPVRHILIYALSGNMKFQCEALAVIGDGKI
ncbi:MAG TPA: RidA family protein [Rhizomicrobium sp.]|jgi:2-iminobutanoate/2-iminopropanoate deaminase|nr:RidA family protein [Rhizomicrobium sp.]